MLNFWSELSAGVLSSFPALSLSHVLGRESSKMLLICDDKLITPQLTFLQVIDLPAVCEVICLSRHHLLLKWAHSKSLGDPGGVVLRIACLSALCKYSAIKPRSIAVGFTVKVVHIYPCKILAHKRRNHDVIYYQ